MTLIATFIHTYRRSVPNECFPERGNCRGHSSGDTRPQRRGEGLPALLDEGCAEGARLVCVHDRPDGTALGSYRYVIELEREKGFSEKELARLEGIEGVKLLGSYERVEG